MRLKTIASPLRAQSGPSAWVWLISVVLHLWVFAHWPTWQAQAAPAPRWQIQFETAPAAADRLHNLTPPTPLPSSPSPPLAAPQPMARPQHDALTHNADTEQTAVSTPPFADLPGASTATPVAEPLQHADTLLAQAKPAMAAASAPIATPAPLSATTGFRAPSGARLRYDLQGIAKGFGYSAKAELLWQPDASQYEARLEVSHFLLGSRVQTSQGQITPEGLAPRRFGDKVRSEQAAHFQRDKGLITYSANTPDAPLLAGTQDRLSVFVQISGMLLAEPQRFGPGAVLNFNTTGARDSEAWAFQLAGMETLKMPYGTIEALRLVRQEQKQYDQRVELWMAPSMEHLPVRIRITQTSGDQVDLLLRSKEAPSP